MEYDYEDHSRVQNPAQGWWGGVCVCYFSHREDSLPEQRNMRKEDRREGSREGEEGGRLERGRGKRGKESWLELQSTVHHEGEVTTTGA